MAASQEVTDPHQLITKQDVEQALKADKGFDAELESFEIKDFTAKGDNYACVVTSVEVQYRKSGKKHETSYVAKLNPCRGKKHETSYVAKLNPCRGDNNFRKMTDIIFEKEIRFYTQVVPLLDKELQKAGEGRLRFAKHFHSVETTGRQVIYLEDLRRSGFCMHNRQKSMDEAHVELIVKELARMHASSALLQENQAIGLAEKFEIFSQKYEMVAMIREFNVIDVFSSSLESTAQLTDQIPGYGYVSEFLREKRPEFGDILENLIPAKEPFKLLSHGDTWNNNFLFRYSTGGVPQECRLLDLQVVRVASPGLDLTHFFYSSTDGQLRRTRLPQFLESYYATFSSILAGTGIPMRFKFSELKKEFSSKLLYGLIWGTLIVPTVLLEPEDTPNLEEFFSGGDMETAMQSFRVEMNKFMLKSPSLRPRLLDLFDDMKAAGVFSSDAVSRLVQSFNQRASVKK